LFVRFRLTGQEGATGEIMLSREDTIAASILGSTLAVCGTCTWLVTRGIQDPGDLLGFFGGALGTGLAVGGTIFLDRRSRRNDRLLLADAIYSVGSTARFAANAPVEHLDAGILTLKQAIHTFDTIRGTTPVRDAQAQRLLSLMTYWLPILIEKLDASLHAVQADAGQAHEEAKKLRPTLEKIFSLAETPLKYRNLWPTTDGKVLGDFEKTDTP
jgi:hypothetical protein